MGNLASFDALMRDQHESPVIAADHAREADRAPSFPAPSRSVSNIPQAPTQA
jgi:hypothetical protein